MSDVRDPDRDQQLPIPNDQPSCHDLVIQDVLERKAHGLRKYQSLLQPFNGRSQAQDAYEEVLDLAAYLRGLLEEAKQIGGRFGSISPELFWRHDLSRMDCADHNGRCCPTPECGHNLNINQYEHYTDVINKVTLL